MPLALPGAVTVLLAQAAALCGSTTVPPASPHPETAVVQRDDAFVIVSAAATEPAPAPIRPASLKLGRTVGIDRDLLVDSGPHASGSAR